MLHLAGSPPSRAAPRTRRGVDGTRHCDGVGLLLVSLVIVVAEFVRFFHSG